jgi:hypothetical protein
MRASDLVGQQVLCRDAPLGRVIDLRLDTGLDSGRGAGGPVEVGDLRLDGLVVSPGRWGGTLGYNRRDAGRPWLLWWLVHRLHRKDRYVRWDLVREWRGGTVQVDASVSELPGVPSLPS